MLQVLGTQRGATDGCSAVTALTGGGRGDKYDSMRVREGKQSWGWGGRTEVNHGKEFDMAGEGPLSRGNLNLDLKRSSQPGDGQG